MATLNVDAIQTVAGKTLVSNSYSGQVGFAQCMMAEQYNFGAPITGNGTVIDPLTIRIQPQNANNILIFDWMFHGETQQDVVFTIHKKVGTGAFNLITTAGEQGYNSVSGNVRYSGIIPGWYDANNETTPSNNRLTYQCIAGTTDVCEFAPAVRASSATARTFYLNRAIGSGTNPYTGQEQNVSYGYCFEFSA